MGSVDGLRKGRLVSAVLTGCWRSAFPPLTLSESDLAEVTPLLCKSGAAALAWRRIRGSALAESDTAQELRQIYRHQSLQATLHEQRIETIFRLFREANVEATLVKGWAVSMLYPQNDLRPAGDIDLYIRPKQFDKAVEAVLAPEASECFVDLHKTFAELPDRSFDDLIARSRLVELGNEQVRILGAEDHLALLCLHLLKHGAWRPLWLCDISVAVESLLDDFDWNICFGKSRQRARSIACAIGLAQRLLQADVSKVPLSETQMEVPKWVEETVLYHWSHLFPGDLLPMRPAPLMARTLWKRGDIVKNMLARWPDPITATFKVNGSFNNFPRFPYQMAYFLRNGTQFIFDFPRKFQSLR